MGFPACRMLRNRIRGLVSISNSYRAAVRFARVRREEDRILLPILQLWTHQMNASKRSLLNRLCIVRKWTNGYMPGEMYTNGLSCFGPLAVRCTPNSAILVNLGWLLNAKTDGSGAGSLEFISRSHITA